MSKAEKTRQNLLTAAKKVLQEQGPKFLTLDAVARQAGASKGGVLYHFPNKNQLHKALVGHWFDEFEKEVQLELEKGTKGWLLAYLKVSFPNKRAAKVKETSALFALFSLSPDLLNEAQARFDIWQNQAVRDGFDPVHAALVRSAIDGLWFNEAFGLHFADETRDDLLRKLENWCLEFKPD